jgi:hypothetical protein
MELVLILKALWRMRWAVLVGFVIATAAAAGLFTKGRSVDVGTASTEILIDGERSALGDLRLQTLPLVARSGIFARFLGADGVTDEIARNAGIPKADIAVVGPKLRVDGVPDPESAERANRIRGTAGHLLQVQQGDNLPLLTIFTQGPTEDAARRLAEATVDALERYVLTYQDEAEIAPERRVKIRQLGPARAGTYVSSPSPIPSIAAFCFLFGLWCFGLLAIRHVVTAWRSPEAWVADSFVEEPFLRSVPAAEFSAEDDDLLWRGEDAPGAAPNGRVGPGAANHDNGHGGSRVESTFGQ